MADTDKEIEAMTSIAQQLVGLDDQARNRVLIWAIARYAPDIKPHAKAAPPTPGHDGGENLEGQQLPDLASFFDAARPKTEPEKVLVVSAWLQRQGGQGEVEGAQVNKELSHMGHRVGNVTNAFNSLMKTSPAHAIQVRKSGKTKQARKKYKITSAGLKRVDKMIAGDSSEE